MKRRGVTVEFSPGEDFERVRPSAGVFAVEPGVTYQMTALVRSGASPWEWVSSLWRERRRTCPLCLMRSWSRVADRCNFCETTAEQLARAGIAA